MHNILILNDINTVRLGVCEYHITYITTAYPDPPDVGALRVLEFRTDSINVSINLIQSQHHKNTAYDVVVIPQVMVTINSTSAKLQVSYNTLYDQERLAARYTLDMT